MTSFVRSIKRLVPRSVLTLVGQFRVFNRLFGQNRREAGICVDGKGDPIPWITYPATEFLSRIDFSAARVFEFGAGSSTLWWAKRVMTVSSVEREADWFARLLPLLPPNATVVLEQDERQYPMQIHRCGGEFDVIVIDGAVRYPCAQEAVSRLAEGGLVLLDNTEWYPNTAHMLRQSGFSQIDFCGFCPVNAFPSCTSLFFRTDHWLKRIIETSEWAPVGGRWLEAHDDCPMSEIDPRTLRR